MKLLDEREGEVAPAELQRSFTRRPSLHRIAVLLAGPAMNLMFAVRSVRASLAMAGTEVVKPRGRAGAPRQSGRRGAGCKRGDEIVAIGDHRGRATPRSCRSICCAP